MRGFPGLVNVNQRLRYVSIDCDIGSTYENIDTRWNNSGSNDTGNNRTIVGCNDTGNNRTTFKRVDDVLQRCQHVCAGRKLVFDVDADIEKKVDVDVLRLYVK